MHAVPIRGPPGSLDLLSVEATWETVLYFTLIITNTITLIQRNKQA